MSAKVFFFSIGLSSVTGAQQRQVLALIGRYLIRVQRLLRRKANCYIRAMSCASFEFNLTSDNQHLSV